MDTFAQRMLRRADSWREKKLLPEHRSFLMRRTSLVLKAIDIDYEDEQEHSISRKNMESSDEFHTVPAHTSSIDSLNAGEVNKVLTDTFSKEQNNDVLQQSIVSSSSLSEDDGCSGATCEKCKLQVKVDVHKSMSEVNYGASSSKFFSPLIDDLSPDEFFSPLKDDLSPDKYFTPSAVKSPPKKNVSDTDLSGMIKMAEQLSLAEEVYEVGPEWEQVYEWSSDVSSYNVETFLTEAIGEEFQTAARSEPELYRRCSLPPPPETETEDSASPYISLRKYRTLTQLARQKYRPALPLPMLKSEESNKSDVALKEEQDKNERKLNKEVKSQKVLMSQCSKALAICKSTREFNSSPEHVEAERGLLLASRRCQAALEEIERVQNIRIERQEVSERGSVTISNLIFSLKNDSLQVIHSEDSVFWFVCLLSHREHVKATKATKIQQDGKLLFGDSLQVLGLPKDFVITLEVYSLRLRRTIVPPEERYHIEQRPHKCPVPFKMPHRGAEPEFTPYGKVVTAAAIRTPAFNLIGTLNLQLNDLRVQMARRLNHLPLSSPLTGDVKMRLVSSLELGVEHCGFLSMRENCGLWQRCWCRLAGHTVSYWNYPDDQQLKAPIGQVDLCYSVSTRVGPVDRILCARPRTLLLETGNPITIGNSKFKKCKPHVTITRHLWQADSQEELLQWCAKLTGVVSALKRWNIIRI